MRKTKSDWPYTPYTMSELRGRLTEDFGDAMCARAEQVYYSSIGHIPRDAL